MAFTTDEEAKLRELISAFNNGKRLNDLPLLEGQKSFNLICEVLDSDGESKQARLDDLIPRLENQCSYGIEWDTAISSPLCTRIGSSEMHRLLPIQSKMRGCLLGDDGTVREYLTPTNWKAHTRDGSAGQVMVEIPSHYRKFTTVGSKQSVRISEFTLPGYHFVPKKYISAYEAVLQRSNGKLCSVVNMSVDYRGGANQADWDGTHRTVLGRPVTNINRADFRAAARLRKSSSTEWNCLDYNTYKDVAWLFYIEYANLNCQAAFNGAKDANGYAQGGLGNGVTTLSATQWGEYNTSFPFVPCGHTDTLGNMSGEVAYTMQNANSSIFATVYTNRYRGIENPFGHIGKFTDGINIEVKTDADGGTSKVYVADNPANFNDSNYNGYMMCGLEARTEGYVKEMIIGVYGDIIPTLIGGGDTVYWCDYHYTILNNSSLRCLRLGGTANRGANSGFGCVYSDLVPSLTDKAVGTRLCFIPKL